MYDNIAQKIKGFVRVFTLVLMLLVLIGGIAAAVLLFQRGTERALLTAIGIIIGAVVADILLYFLSCFAYALGEHLENQATLLALNRQLVGALRTQTATQPQVQTSQMQTPQMQTPQAPQPVPSGYAPQHIPQPEAAPYYRTQTPYGTATGFNENFHYEPRR